MHRSHLNSKLIICLCLIVLTYLAFSHVLKHDFINLDDNIYVTENPYIKKGLSREGFLWAFTKTNDAGLWIPLTWLSLMLDYQLYGLNAGGYLLTNLLLHILNAVLLFLVLERITKGLWQSGFVAALFALHPLRVESVAWITERKDVLSTLFFILTIWAYARYTENQTLKRYFLILFFFAMGLIAKPMLVSLPFVLLLLDYWPLGRFRSERPLDNHGSEHYRFFNRVTRRSSKLWLIIEKIPLFSLAALMSCLTFFTQKHAGAVSSIDSLPLSLRVPNALVSYVKYILKMVWPRNLAIFYPYPSTFPMWQITGALLFLLGISFLIICKAHRPYLAVGWFWYLVSLIPVIGLVQSGLQAMADRFTYVPLIGLFIMIAWGVPDILSRWRYRKTCLVILAAAAISQLMIRTSRQVRLWQDNMTLFRHTLDVTDKNWLIHYNLGHALIRQGNITQGIAHYQEALSIKPDYEQAHYNLGLTLTRQGKIKEGIAHYIKALEINPDSERVHNNLGACLEKQGNTKEAILHYQRALEINPDYGLAHFNLAVALAGQGDHKEAIFHYRKALRLMPNFAKAHFHLGLAYSEIGNNRAALEEYNTLNLISPDLANILFDKIHNHNKDS